MPASPNTVPAYPDAFGRSLDEVLTGATYANRYDSSLGAEFVGGRTVRVPMLDFGSDPAPKPYSRFDSETGVTLNYQAYNLANDYEQQFYIDALETEDTGGVLTAAAVAAQWTRTVLAPFVDSKLFADAFAARGNTDSPTPITSWDSLKAAIRAARSQAVAAGLGAGELYLTSDLIAILEDGAPRQWGNDTSLNTTIGSYNGFDIFEVPEATLGTNVQMLAVSGGTTTLRHVVKRAVTYTFPAGSHTKGDGDLTQIRWVFGTIALAKKRAGIWALKSA